MTGQTYLPTQSHGRMAVRDPFDDIKNLVNIPDPLIVDGGAFAGPTIKKFLGIFEKPVIHAFEPNPDMVERLIRNFSSRGINIHPMALGSENKKIPFFILNAPQSSSFLKPGTWAKNYHGEKMETFQTIDVDSIRLDTFFENTKIDILKLDLQGFELEALKGAEGILHNIRLISTEVEFVPLYENQPLFSEIELFLRQRGFRLYNLYELWTHPDGQLTAGDALFLNERFFNPFNPLKLQRS